jgi:thiamine kinase-like enzyme
MNTERLHAQRLQALDFWTGPIELEPLHGGITNHNYRVRCGSRSYVARLSVERAVLGIDRRNEVVCQREARACGVAPAVVHHEPGVLVSEHIDAQVLNPAGVRDHSRITRLAGLLRSLHDGWDRISGEILYFSAFQTVRTYALTAGSLGARLPVDCDELIEDARRLSHQIGPFVPVLCHNDLLAANILDDGRRLWFVDWEYAGVGHPLFDLANLSANAAFSDQLDEALLAAYRGESSARPRDLHELRLLKVMSLLREALWSLIQTVASDIAFDYHRYAVENFLAYREAREKIDL